MREKIPSIPLITLIVLVTASMCLAGEPDRLELAREHEDSRDYEKAEQVYLNILQESTQTDDALQAQEGLTCLYITWGRRPEAEAAIQQLLDGFSQHEGAPAAVANVADAYQALGRHKKACELYNYFLENWPEGEQAMWSQMSLTISNIALGNDSETQECVETLLTDFGGDERLAGTLNDIADACRELQKFEKAREFYQYALDTQPQAKDAMWAEVFLVGLDVVLGNGEVAQSAMEELLTGFTDYEEMPGILAGKTNDCTSLAYDCTVKRKFKEARELCQYVSDNWPDNEVTIDAQAGVANSNLALGEPKAAGAAIEKLLTQFSDNPRIAQAVCEVAFQCLYNRRYERARELFECILDNWTDSEEAIQAHAGLAWYGIAAGDESNAQAKIAYLIADFADNPDLAMAVSLIAEGYWEQALQERREGLHDEAEVHFRKALGVWLRVIEELPEIPHTTASAYHFAGECYRVLEEDENAIKYYQMVVDSWPDYESAWIAQSLIGYLTKNLMKKGVIPKSEADVVMRDAFERVVKNYPDCGAANAARNWLKYNVKPKEGE